MTTPPTAPQDAMSDHDPKETEKLLKWHERWREIISLPKEAHAAFAQLRAAQAHIEERLRTELAAAQERYDALEKSVLDLSHPNCRMLLKERDAWNESAYASETARKAAVEALKLASPFFAEDMPEGPDDPKAFATNPYREAYRAIQRALAAQPDAAPTRPAP